MAAAGGSNAPLTQPNEQVLAPHPGHVYLLLASWHCSHSALPLSDGGAPVRRPETGACAGGVQVFKGRPCRCNRRRGCYENPSRENSLACKSAQAHRCSARGRGRWRPRPLCRRPSRPECAAVRERRKESNCGADRAQPMAPKFCVVQQQPSGGVWRPMSWLGSC